MALYGYKAMPQRSSDPYKDYFKEVREGIDSRVLLDEAKKTAEEAAIGSMGGVPDLGANSMFMSYSDPYQQMATILKDNKDEMLKTPEGRQEYQALMDAAIQFSADGKAQTAYINPLLQRNMQISRSGINPKEWEAQGMRDSHSYEDYVEYTRAIDTARYQVSKKGGEWVLSDGNQEYASNDNRLFSRKYFENNLVQTEPIDPLAWYTTSKPRNDTKVFENKEAASEWVRATISSSEGRGKRDAVKWFINSDKNKDGLTLEEIQNDVTGNAVDKAISAYADEAVKNWSPYVSSSGSPGTNPSNTSSSPTLSLEGASDDYNMLINIDDNYAATKEGVEASDPTTGTSTYENNLMAQYNFLGKAKNVGQQISEYPEEPETVIKSIRYDSDSPYQDENGKGDFRPQWTIEFKGGNKQSFNADNEQGFNVFEDYTTADGGPIYKIQYYQTQFDLIFGNGSFMALLAQLQKKAKEQA